MTKKELQLCKKKILKCLTEDFTYGKTKQGKSLKHPRKNQALWDKKEKWQNWTRIDLDMVMDRVVRGLYFAFDDFDD